MTAFLSDDELPSSGPRPAELGWSSRWAAALAVLQMQESEELVAARISAVHRGAVEAYRLSAESSSLEGAAAAAAAASEAAATSEPLGSPAPATLLSIDLRLPGHAEEKYVWPPAVGDWVALNDAGRIRGILPRGTYLERPRGGAYGPDQALAANIDIIGIVEPFFPEPAPGRIERFTALARSSGCQAWLILSKADLATSPEEAQARLEELSGGTDTAFAVSAEDPASVQALRGALPVGSSLILMGRSGAGKSTLSNALLGTAQETQSVREGDGKGRHTTTSRQLLAGGGTILIDTPGIRALAAVDHAEAIDETFEDIADLARQCVYRNCAHESEPGCAVREAVERGDLDADRLGRYLRMRAEVAHRRIQSDPRLRREEERRASKNDSRGRRGVMLLKGKL